MPVWKFDLLYLVIGAIAGAYLRYRMGNETLHLFGIPVTILLINVIGCFVLGLSMTAISKLGLGQNYIILLGIGFCGSFTTMSSFAFEATGLLDNGQLLLGLVDVGLNVGLSMAAILAGRALVVTLSNII
ncbi:MAG: CrcB family protein [Nitrososphaerota archaeon]|jgi:CrcB protein|nr:CrcB family protein [Nitrososphaerota archaeon]